MYYIARQSEEGVLAIRDGKVMWWRIGACGYTIQLDEAGLWDLDEAKKLSSRDRIISAVEVAAVAHNGEVWERDIPKQVERRTIKERER